MNNPIRAQLLRSCLCLILLVAAAPVQALEPVIADDRVVPSVLAKRGKLILDDNGSKPRGGKTVAKFDGQAKLRAGAGAWQRVANSNVWRSTWEK